MWVFDRYEPGMGYAVRSRVYADNLKASQTAAWFVYEDDAKQYAALMNIINPNHNSPGSH